MKLYEVLNIPEPEDVPEPIDRYWKRLHRHKSPKITGLGGGAYAEVFQHPTHKNVVAKVTRAGTQILDYIEFAAAHADNPYLPKIYDVRRFRGGSRKEPYFIVFMERLKEYDVLTPRRKFNVLVKHLGTYIYNKAVRVNGSLDYEVAPDFFYDELRHGHGVDMVKFLDMKDIRARMPLAKYLAQAIELFVDRNFWDVSDNNIMLRGKDQIVFTDPTV